MPTTPDPRLVPALVLALVLLGCTPAENGDDVPATPGPPPGGTPAAGSGPPASGTPVAPSGRTPPATDLPTLRPPTGPPRHPTDVRKPGALAGRITRGGDGPCYGLITDDGREYALHGPGMGTFPTGTWVRVTVGPAPDGVDCGPGQPAGLVKIERIG